MAELAELVLDYINYSSNTSPYKRVIVDLPNVLSADYPMDGHLDNAPEFILVTKLESLVWHYKYKPENLAKILNKYTQQSYHIIIIDLPKCSNSYGYQSCTKYADPMETAYNGGEKPCATAHLSGGGYVTDFSTVGHDTCSPDDMIQLLLNMSENGKYRGVITRDQNILTTFNIPNVVDLHEFDKLAIAGMILMSGYGQSHDTFNLVYEYGKYGNLLHKYEEPLFDAIKNIVHKFNPPRTPIYLEPFNMLPHEVRKK
ncbi:hypothetical protein EhV156_00005 [Emiliania huxleyi virus 156]|nr:hypothetical protein EhV156_00005 [Emiliania huxleyi virus 156]